MIRFRVSLDAYCGPLELLLYLVKRHELDVCDIPLSIVAQQYDDVLSQLAAIDVDAAGDFLDVATRLMELKSRLLLPTEETELPAEEVVPDGRRDLVRRLLEYRRFKDAAAMLEERALQWQQRFARRENDLAPAPGDLASQPIAHLELWDLVSALSKVLKSRAPAVKPTTIRYEETPVEVHMERLLATLAQRGTTRFADLFEGQRSRPYVVGAFLAMLELIRNGRIAVAQQELFGDIWVSAAEAATKGSATVG